MRRRTRNRYAASLLGALIACATVVQGEPEDVSVIRPERRTGFENAGWKYDRYGDLPSLDAHSRMTVAELRGPGVIRHIHTTRHRPKEILTRGIVLEIWFDGAETPSVLCPLGDFFGDGCNGRGAYFSSKFIECAPWSYNCYFPMPFKDSARVVLRNDTGIDAMNYSYVEWESLPSWDESLGYFHATYRRKSFQLSKDSNEVFFSVKGRGHLIGRQYSVVTDEPLFRGFNVVMEGNNEVDIDGEARALDYLGTEDSFTFSWGFQEVFAGLRAGMTLVEHGDLNRLSAYRFHDAMPLRFRESLRWSVNWSQERFFTANPKWQEAVDAGGCWVDYATVTYWYQSEPGGFEHEPLPPLGKRRLTMLCSEDVMLRRLLDELEVDPSLTNEFSAAADLERVRIVGTYPHTHPFWIDEPEPRGGHPGNPNPGRRGILAVHPADGETPCYILRKVRLPAETAWKVRVTISGDPYEAPGKSEFPMAVGIHDGSSVRWCGEWTIQAGATPSIENWRTVECALKDAPEAASPRILGIVVRTSYGGPHPALNEEAFLDEISVVPAGD